MNCDVLQKEMNSWFELSSSKIRLLTLRKGIRHILYSVNYTLILDSKKESGAMIYQRPNTLGLRFFGTFCLLEF